MPGSPLCGIIHAGTLFILPPVLSQRIPFILTQEFRLLSSTPQLERVPKWLVNALNIFYIFAAPSHSRSACRAGICLEAFDRKRKTSFNLLVAWLHAHSNALLQTQGQWPAASSIQGHKRRSCVVLTVKRQCGRS